MIDIDLFLLWSTAVILSSQKQSYGVKWIFTHNIKLLEMLLVVGIGYEKQEESVIVGKKTLLSEECFAPDNQGLLPLFNN